MVTSGQNKGTAWRKRLCKEQCPVDVGEEDQVWLGQTTSAHGANLPWSDQLE